MKSIPNPVGFVLLIGIVVSISQGLTARPGLQLIMSAAGLVTTIVLAGIVAVGLWVRSRYRAGRSN